MSKSIIALLSFILGGGIGIVLMSCLFIEKEMGSNERNTKKGNN